MYDALLDGLEDEPMSRPDETLDLADDPVEALDVDDDLDRAVLDDDEEHDPELDVNADDLLAGVEDESWSDDPVRMYLTQMGEIPLLTRQQEVALAKQIELTRTRFRRKVLECDYVMQTAVKVLAAGPRGRAALRPHRAGLGDRPAGEAPDSRPAAAQPAHAGDSAEAEPPRLQRRHQQVARRRPSAGRPGGGWAAAAAAPSAWSRNSACGPSGSSR